MNDGSTIETLLAQIAQSLGQIAMAMSPAPHIRKPIAEYRSFDWASIGARILKEDNDGPAIVEWNGKPYKRRAPDNKYGAAIWFSRCVGKSEDGTNQYATLISFEIVSDDVDPIGKKARQALRELSSQASAPTQRQAQQTRPSLAPQRVIEEESEEQGSEDEDAELAAMEAEHRQVEHDLKKIFTSSGKSLGEWELYYNEKDLANQSLADKRKTLDSWRLRAQEKGLKIHKSAA